LKAVAEMAARRGGTVSVKELHDALKLESDTTSHLIGRATYNLWLKGLIGWKEHDSDEDGCFFLTDRGEEVVEKLIDGLAVSTKGMNSLRLLAKLGAVGEENAVLFRPFADKAPRKGGIGRGYDPLADAGLIGWGREGHKLKIYLTQKGYGAATA
jgi:hypothetical protein